MFEARLKNIEELKEFENKYKDRFKLYLAFNMIGFKYKTLDIHLRFKLSPWRLDLLILHLCNKCFEICLLNLSFRIQWGEYA